MNFLSLEDLITETSGCSAEGGIDVGSCRCCCWGRWALSKVEGWYLSAMGLPDSRRRGTVTAPGLLYLSSLCPFPDTPARSLEKAAPDLPQPLPLEFSRQVDCFKSRRDLSLLLPPSRSFITPTLALPPPTWINLLPSPTPVSEWAIFICPNVSPSSRPPSSCLILHLIKTLE